MGNIVSGVIGTTADGSVVGADGRILYFSTERFIRDICEGDCCFVCGASAKDCAFTDEHVIPRWILRRFDLFDKEIGLPNGDKYRYDRYKVPCCAACNAFPGRNLERPVSEVLSGTYEEVMERINAAGYVPAIWLIFKWMALLFLKTHLKDRELFLNRDRRSGEGRISDLYDWGELHHIHCVARAPYTQCELDDRVLGSVQILPAKKIPGFGGYDYGDVYQAQTLFVTLDEIAIVAVLNDSCGSFQIARNHIERVGGRVSPLQIREVMAHLACANLHLKERPVFISDFAGSTYRMRATHPALVEAKAFSAEVYGELLYLSTCGIIDVMTQPGADEIRRNVRAGTFTFLVDRDGKFDATSMDPIPQ